MKAFTWHRGEVRLGIKVVDDDKLGPVVHLGEGGPGRRYEKLSLGRKRPAEVVDGCIYEAKPRDLPFPPERGGSAHRFVVLDAPTGASTAVLVRINTQWVRIKGTNGDWRIIAGKPKIVMRGNGARGIDGQDGVWDDILLEMHPGDIIKVAPEGGDQIGLYALWLVNGVPHTMLWQDYADQHDVEELAEDGDGPRVWTFGGEEPAEFAPPISDAADPLQTLASNFPGTRRKR